MFIKDDAIADWEDLQDKVAQLFDELGCEVQTPFVVELAGRGRKAVDVFARDRRTSMERITLVECKWWNTEVPQDTVHAFHTIMQRSGANEGFVVSKVGFQAGAYEAAQHTNINLLTFGDLQHRFGNEWFLVQKATVSQLLQPLRQASCLHFDQFNPITISNNMFFHTQELADRLTLLGAWNKALLIASTSIWPESYLGPEPVRMANDPLKPFLEVPNGRQWHEAPTVREYFRRLIAGLKAWNTAYQNSVTLAHRTFDRLPADRRGELMDRSLLELKEESPIRVLKDRLPREEYDSILHLL
ncbi:MAG: restriction endonuclease [Limisphaerales bacterium]